jgi:hypothetical protein
MAKPGIELSNDDHLQELVTGETQPSEQKKRMLRTITESMRARAQSLSRLVKKRKDKT